MRCTAYASKQFGNRSIRTMISESVLIHPAHLDRPSGRRELREHFQTLLHSFVAWGFLRVILRESPLQSRFRVAFAPMDI